MRFRVRSRAEYLSRFQIFVTFILLDVRLVAKALKGEITRFLLFFCFTTKQVCERAKRLSISAQEVQ
jgi:hypothetical protein